MEKQTASGSSTPNQTPIDQFQSKLSYQQLNPNLGSTSSRLASLHRQMQQQMQASLQMPPPRPRNQVVAEMVQQDANHVCNPDIKRPFESIEDAVNRLLPYHLVADYEDEDDEWAKLQQRDRSMSEKMVEFKSTFEKQVDCFNAICKGRSLGEFRAEEGLMFQKAMHDEEEQELARLKAERDRCQMEARAQMQMMNRVVPPGMTGFDAFGLHGDNMMRSWDGGHHIGASSSNVVEQSDGRFNVGNRDQGQ